MNDLIHQSRPPSRVVDPEGPLELRAPAVAEAPALVAAIGDSLDTLRRFMPWAHVPQTVDGQYGRLCDAVAAYWKGDDYVMHIYDPGEPSRLLGCVGLHRRAMNRSALELGYWIRTGYEGRGICTRAARMTVVMAIERFRCRRVQCGYDTANLASARVGEKVGFVVEGDLLDYGPSGDDAMRGNGWQADEVNRMTSLDPKRARNQPWYGPMRDRLKWWDWRGEAVDPGAATG